jgi:hypothetical protein
MNPCETGTQLDSAEIPRSRSLVRSRHPDRSKPGSKCCLPVGTPTPLPAEINYHLVRPNPTGTLPEPTELRSPASHNLLPSKLPDSVRSCSANSRQPSTHGCRCPRHSQVQQGYGRSPPAKVKCEMGRNEPSHFRTVGSRFGRERDTGRGFSPRQQVKDVPLLPVNKNYFNVLTVEEIKNDSSIISDTSNKEPESPAWITRRPRWERKLPETLKIDAAEPGSNSLYLRVEIESTETQRKQGIRTLVDCGATGLFIDREYVKSNRLPTKKLSRVIPVFNVDGTPNEAGCISEVVELIIHYEKYLE